MQDGIINFYNTAAGKTQMIPGHRVRRWEVGFVLKAAAGGSLLIAIGFAADGLSGCGAGALMASSSGVGLLHRTAWGLHAGRCSGQLEGGV